MSVDMAVRSRLDILISNRNTALLEAGQKRLTLRKVAAESGVPLSVLYGLTAPNREKRSKLVALGTLDKLCSYFNCPLTDILEYTPDNT